jgi:hypothetical protein
VLACSGKPFPRPDAVAGVIGHDSTLIGWPWVDGTHSWLEPTAMAILALCREGLGDHPRVVRGTELILDRAIPGGGWNYGNSAVFGRRLRPQPAPTGLALLALTARGAPLAGVSAALDYLRGVISEIRAPLSLAWGVLALRACDACPAAAGTWLEESFARCPGRDGATADLALLLLAASAGGTELLLARAGV